MKIEPPQEYWETEPDGKKLSWPEFLIYQTLDLVFWAGKISLAFYIIYYIYVSLTPVVISNLATQICPLIK